MFCCPTKRCVAHGEIELELVIPIVSSSFSYNVQQSVNVNDPSKRRYVIACWCGDS